MQKKYHNDCFLGVMYGSAEYEAFGGTSIFQNEYPPNAGAPVINSYHDIETLQEPIIEESPILKNILKTIELLKQESKGEIPILSIVISPFSLPVMQMGFSAYLDLMISNQPMFQKLMNINKSFCIKWANRQLEAGASAIGYVDPVSSPTIITKQMFRNLGWPVAKEVISSIKGATATHYASGRSIANIEDMVETGTKMFAVSSHEDIGEAKRLANSRMAVLGNLNGIEMCRWSKNDAERAVKEIAEKAAKGGGLVISDNHGEIPYQVPEKVLLALADAVDKFGKY